jgi:hypothetical protein
MRAELLFFLLPIIVSLISLVGFLLYRSWFKENKHKEESRRLITARLERKRQAITLLNKRKRRIASFKRQSR